MSISAALTGPRYARRASAVRIVRAQVVFVGRDLSAGTMKIWRRLGVSPTPVALNGPVIVSVLHAAGA